MDCGVDSAAAPSKGKIIVLPNAKTKSKHITVPAKNIINDVIIEIPRMILI
jgi:hypothetical protein